MVDLCYRQSLLRFRHTVMHLAWAFVLPQTFRWHVHDVWDSTWRLLHSTIPVYPVYSRYIRCMHLPFAPLHTVFAFCFISNLHMTQKRVNEL